ncbi:MAG: hypothetical protein M4D80_11810 [Myxococcota bacterium]|nr:DoxX family membrane protein [Deltaproteobacteria bacterium]MDQ3335844.1 hypothetical protein [Myxococcota bacterium]
MAQPVWSVPRRVALRFGVVAGALFLFPFPLGLIPGTRGIAAALSKPWDWLVPWFAENVLGLARPQHVFTGSGDTMFVWVQTLLIVILAAFGAAVWSALDRQRVAYPRLQAGAIVALRLFLCTMMVLYGVAKLVEAGQFPAPSPARMDQSFGEASPMGLLWTFMGHSKAYTVFGGLAELAGGLLLLSRRTTVVGALIVAGVMTNIVMLNMSYDVPVKLFSMQLLLCALLILLPHARRVTAALLGYAVAEVAPRVRGTARVERVRLVAKLAFASVLLFGAWQAFTDRTRPPKSELHGVWVVETFTADGVEHAPLITDAVRWRKLIVSERGVSVRAMTDQRTWFWGAKVDPAARTITFEMPETKTHVVWRYTRSDAHLVVDGTFRGKQLHVTFVKEPEPLLATRGFHWVQEVPFNR